MALKTVQRLSHYRFVDKLGEGGMGVVWRAVDTRLDREVAIKMLPADLERDPERLARFDHEARIVAALSHPNIVTIHAVEEADGQRFLVMELVRGVTLDRVIPRDGLPLARFFDIALAVTDAVRAAHDRGVTHRDLKPGNVMVGEDGRPKVLDFGVAKSAGLRGIGAAVDRSEAPTRTLPSAGRIVGTLPYMSPEQVKGDEVDGRSDLFSLGCILYEMATGRAPFAGTTGGDLIASILRDTPRALTAIRRDLPRQLARIVGRALEKDPSRRFQTARELHRELDRLRDEVARGVAALDTDAAAREVRSIAVLPLDDLSRDPDQAYFADGMTDALINTLAHVGALKVISRTSVMGYRGARKRLPDVARELGVDAVIEGSVLRAGGRVRVSAQLIDATRDKLLWAESYEHELGDVLALQRRVARAITERIEVELTPQERAHFARERAVAPDVQEACLKGRYFWYQRTTESVRRGLACFEEAVRLDASWAPAHAGIADSYIVDGGRYLGVAPDVAYARAREAALRALELDDRLAEAHTSLAAVMTDYDWNWSGADREYRRAIELNPNYVTAHSWYAEQLSRMGRHDEAVAEARRARDLDPLSLASAMIVAWILFFARRYDEAIEQARGTLALEPDFATAHRILGWAYEETGRCEEAIAAHRRAAELTDRQPNFTGQLGRAYALAGRTDEARALLADLLEQSHSTYVSALDVAIIHTALGERDRALDWLERAHDERADHLPYLRVNPRLDALRDEPRFQRVLERMGLATPGPPDAPQPRRSP